MRGPTAVAVAVAACVLALCTPCALAGGKARKEEEGEGRVRLVGEGWEAGTRGRVEVLHNGVWGAVCNDMWDLKNGNVVCGELGLGSAVEIVKSAPPSTGPLWLDDVRCDGTEGRLVDCRHQPWGVNDCDNSEHVGVVCGSCLVPRLSNAQRFSGGACGAAGGVVVSGTRCAVSCVDGYAGSPASILCENGEFSGSAAYCTDINECATGNGGCDGMSTCLNEVGSFSCGGCPAGFSGDGNTGCHNINECAVNNGGCDAYVVCQDRQGSRDCGACPPGFTGSGDTSCVDVNECATANGGCGEKICQNSEGSMTCGSCPPGLVELPEDGVCVDVNECAVNNGGCDGMVACTNTRGSFVCAACPVGFVGDSTSRCIDLDECLVNNGNCDPLAPCSNTVGSRDCGPCPSGYYGNGYLGCHDINECATNNGGCDAKVMCMNSPGSFSCGSCPSGYAGNPTAGCADVNECAFNNGGCHSLTACVNTEGSSLCSECPQGYSGSGRTSCQDINECGVNNGGCDPFTLCSNTVGGHSCGMCPSGYTRTANERCEDVNECATNNGGCDDLTQCDNYGGSFTCGPCPRGYTGNGREGCVDTIAPGAFTLQFLTQPVFPTNQRRVRLKIVGGELGASFAFAVVSSGVGMAEELKVTGTGTVLSEEQVVGSIDVSSLPHGTLVASMRLTDAHGNQGHAAQATTVKYAQLQAQYIRINLRGRNYLSFAEVRVWAGATALPLRLVRVSSQYHTHGRWSGEAAVDGDTKTCYGAQPGGSGEESVVVALESLSVVSAVEVDTHDCGYGTVSQVRVDVAMYSDQDQWITVFDWTSVGRDEVKRFESTPACVDHVTFSPDGLFCQLCNTEIQCAAGQGRSGCSQSRDTRCVPCTLGKTFSRDHECVACTAGLSCTAGTELVPCSLTSDTFCRPCVLGHTYSRRGSACLPCSTPSCDSGLGVVACTLESNAMCVPCVPGLTWSDGSTACKACNNVPAVCPAGKVPAQCTQSRNAGCQDCPPGFFSTDGLTCNPHTTDLQCSPGTGVVAGTSSTDASCQPCVEGVTWSDDGKECRRCSEGTCEAGTERVACTKTRDRQCVACRRGTYSEDGTTCHVCSAKPLSCPRGQQPVGCSSAQDAGCYACERGVTYSSDGLRCRQCSTNVGCSGGHELVGCTLVSDAQCAECVAGETYSTDGTVCHKCSAPSCPAGFAPAECTVTRDSQCEECGVDSFSHDGLQCLECSRFPGDSCTAGHAFRPCTPTSDAFCEECIAGETFSLTGVECVPCSSGLVCAAGYGRTECTPTANHQCVRCQDGFFSDGRSDCQQCSEVTCPDGVDVVPCSPRADAMCYGHCIGWPDAECNGHGECDHATAACHCASEYEGASCGHCVATAYRSPDTGLCVMCSEPKCKPGEELVPCSPNHDAYCRECLPGVSFSPGNGVSCSPCTPPRDVDCANGVVLDCTVRADTRCGQCEASQFLGESGCVACATGVTCGAGYGLVACSDSVDAHCAPCEAGWFSPGGSGACVQCSEVAECDGVVRECSSSSDAHCQVDNPTPGVPRAVVAVVVVGVCITLGGLMFAVAPSRSGPSTRPQKELGSSAAFRVPLSARSQGTFGSVVNRGGATTARALFDFVMDDDRILPIRQGDVMTLVGTPREGWVEAEKDGIVGLVPFNHVEMVQGDNAPPAPALNNPHSSASHSIQRPHTSGDPLDTELHPVSAALDAAAAASWSFGSFVAVLASAVLPVLWPWTARGGWWSVRGRIETGLLALVALPCLAVSLFGTFEVAPSHAQQCIACAVFGAGVLATAAYHSHHCSTPQPLTVAVFGNGPTLSNSAQYNLCSVHDFIERHEMFDHSTAVVSWSTHGLSPHALLSLFLLSPALALAIAAIQPAHRFLTSPAASSLTPFALHAVVLFLSLGQVFRVLVEGALLRQNLACSMERFAKATRVPVVDSPFVLQDSRGVQCWLDARFFLLRKDAVRRAACDHVHESCGMLLASTALVLFGLGATVGYPLMAPIDRIVLVCTLLTTAVLVVWSSTLNEKVLDAKWTHLQLLSSRRDEIALCSPDQGPEGGKVLELMSQIIAFLRRQDMDTGMGGQRSRRGTQASTLWHVAMVVLAVALSVRAAPPAA